MMEYLEGEDLSQRLERGRVPIEDAVDYVSRERPAVLDRVASPATSSHNPRVPAAKTLRVDFATATSLAAGSMSPELQRSIRSGGSRVGWGAGHPGFTQRRVKRHLAESLLIVADG
ncbi:MAG: hypothetical protein ABI895_20150 [Deltaproteobacteria bacterium]